MFAVIFEVTPKPEHRAEYLRHAGMLRPELVKIDGFLANERYASLRRPGWLVSLSSWRNEKAVVRWRTFAAHHQTQAEGRAEILADYHLRVGEVIADSGLPPGDTLSDERRDETEIGAAKFIVLNDREILGLPDQPDTAELAAMLGLSGAGEQGELVDWDVFRHLQRPDEYLLLTSWTTIAAVPMVPMGARQRTVRIIRDYGMFDRREAPQYHPPVERPAATS